MNDEISRKIIHHRSISQLINNLGKKINALKNRSRPSIRAFKL